MSLKKKIRHVLLNTQVTKLTMEPGNRMARVGVGQHNTRLFARIDLWSVGYRITKR